MSYLSNKRLLAEMSIALVMAIVATLTLEHSQIDLMVADWFYLGMGHWMVAKQAFLPDLLLYSGLKKLLMAMLIYLLVATIYRAYHEKKAMPSLPSGLSQWQNFACVSLCIWC